jgi:CheY-like chemotaxis protein
MPVPKRVLVVDDDAEIQEVISLALGDVDYEVVSARDGAAALAVLRRDQRGWVVLLDWMMPGMDGQATLEAVSREDELHCCNSFILMTAGARTMPLPLVRLLGQLEVGYLAKPFELDTLIEMVDHAHARVERYVERCPRHSGVGRFGRTPATTPLFAREAWLPTAHGRE